MAPKKIKAIRKTYGLRKRDEEFHIWVGEPLG